MKAFLQLIHKQNNSMNMKNSHKKSHKITKNYSKMNHFYQFLSLKR